MLQLNTPNLHKVMQDFHTLTKIRIVIFDSNFKELMAYPLEREPFCHLLRQTPNGEAACFVSDKGGCLKCAKSRNPVIYRCHAGLTEVVVPIVDKGSILAYVMFGQFILKEGQIQTKKEIRCRFPDFSQEVEQLPVKTQQELNAAATVLQAITTYVMTNRWLVSNKSTFISEIDRYIEEHLADNISVDDICKTFRIGRTKLYQLSMNYLGCGLAEYIRKQRISHSQRMLKETDLPITDIAFASGFSDYNHFSRIFRKITGLSARQYRNSQ